MLLKYAKISFFLFYFLDIKVCSAHMTKYMLLGVKTAICLWTLLHRLDRIFKVCYNGKLQIKIGLFISFCQD